ncbi:MAG: hypothetical protein Q9220_006084 [cf. Caloplaca sp. 1 TL-2023]
MSTATKPGLRPPPGVEPDFRSHGPNHEINLVTIGLCLGLCTLLLAVQLATKYFYMNGLKWEDYSAILAWVGDAPAPHDRIQCANALDQALLIPFGVLGLITVLDYGASKHQWNVTLSQVEHFASLANAIEILYHLLILTIKLSVLLQYLRIFVPRRNRAFYLAWLLIGVNVTLNISLAFSFAFECVPRQKLWRPAMDGHCINLASAFIVSATTNTITDFAVFLLPLFAIWELQLPWERKLGVSAVFTVGLLYVFASPTRHRVIKVLATKSGPDNKKSGSAGRHKPYCQLEERAAVNLSLPDASVCKHSNEDEELWKWDIERGMVEDGIICKTVTIDQTSRRVA